MLEFIYRLIFIESPFYVTIEFAFQIRIFQRVVYDIFKQQHNLLVENKSLESLKQFLLPLLMNGQVIVTKN